MPDVHKSVGIAAHGRSWSRNAEQHQYSGVDAIRRARARLQILFEVIKAVCDG